MDNLVVNCPSCSVRLTLNDDRAGSSLCCPRCETPILVPGQRSPLPSSPRPRPNLMPSPSGSAPVPAHKAPVWVIGMGLVLCFVGLVLAPYFLFAKKDKTHTADSSSGPERGQNDSPPSSILPAPTAGTSPLVPKVSAPPKTDTRSDSLPPSKPP